MKAAAIYIRISSDRGGTRAGVRRQLEDCRSWAQRNGAAVAEVYEDNDVSAYRGSPGPPTDERARTSRQASVMG